ncbi:MAG: hypothetical protein RBU23_07785 [Candidatus Auribacterota bacterium]|jgi:hypothetical protein|nr:hypothetical protein [Candidatus Auribacterota bacterium]
MDEISKYDPQPLISPLLSEGKNNDESGIVLLLSSNMLGANKRRLGEKLMHQFLFSLTEMPPRIRSIILINEAVKLAFKGSSVLEPLQLLSDSKINILICQQSVKCHGDLSAIAVGTTASMYIMVNQLLSAEKVISM